MANIPLIAGIELGGTKCIALLASGPEDIRDRITVATGASRSPLPPPASASGAAFGRPLFCAAGLG